MLGKVFNMSGLYKGPLRQAEPEGGFRRAMNVWQDRTGKWRPKGEQAALATLVSPYADSQIIRTGFTRRFKGGIFSCFLANFDFTASPYDLNNTANVFQYTLKDGSDATPYHNYSAASMEPSYAEWQFGRNTYPSTVVGNKLFFKVSDVLPLMKFDGVQILPAGLPVPKVGCAQYNTTPTRWVKLLQCRIGFDGTLVASGVLKFPVNNNNITLTLHTGDLIGSASVTPPYRDSHLDTGNLDDIDFVERNTAINWSYDSGNDTMTMAYTSKSAGIAAGSWVMFSNIELATSEKFHIIAMKVVSVVGGNIVFDANAKGYSKSNLSWSDVPVSTFTTSFAAAATTTKWGGSIVFMVYSSATENGTFLLSHTFTGRGLDGSSGAFSVTCNAINTPATASNFFFGGQTTSDIQGWYDIGTVKQQFPAFHGIGTYNPKILGMTKYQGLLLTYDKNAIYFSDTSAGGSDEMISGFSNFVPLGSENGDIVCVEGCEDFILIGRERKNYVLVGDLATGNFTINECDADSPGPWSSTSAIAVRGGVAFVTRQGAFFCTSSGSISEVSEGISRLFGAAREFDEDPDHVSFQPYLMTDVSEPDPDDESTWWDGNIVRMKYDKDRNLLAILFAKKWAVGAADPDDKYAILAMNLKSGAMFEWKTDSGGANDVMVTDFEFLEHYDPDTGKFLGSLVQAGTELTQEDISETQVSPRFLLTSWLTGGEPSLEKQVKQVKFYGQMTSCKVYHQENWEGFTSLDAIAAPRTNVTYPTTNNQNTNDFEHKQRLNTSRCQAVSVGFEPLDDNFSLEGYEIEWDLIQETVKK
jgi:hypothetical protein